MNRFEDLLRLHISHAFVVDDNARDSEDAVVGAGGEVHRFHRVFEIAGAGGIQRSMLADGGQLFAEFRGGNYLKSTKGTSQWMSILSNNGPEMRWRKFSICREEQRH